MTKLEVIRMALDALKIEDRSAKYWAACYDLQEELEKPEPEPVAWTYPTTFKSQAFINGLSGFIWVESHAADMIPLYTKD
jgi:hypothetical protein